MGFSLRHAAAAALLLGLAVLVLACGGGTDPAEGQPCPSPGSVYAHDDVRLTCDQNGEWAR